jgi:hypothetical protein
MKMFIVTVFCSLQNIFLCNNTKVLLYISNSKY